MIVFSDSKAVNWLSIAAFSSAFVIFMESKSSAVNSPDSLALIPAEFKRLISSNLVRSAFESCRLRPSRALQATHRGNPGLVILAAALIAVSGTNSAYL